MTRRNFQRSFFASLEWRLYAFVLTYGYLLVVMNKTAAQAAAFSLGLQLILLAGHTLWLSRRRP